MDILRPSAKGKRSLIQILEAWANTRPDKIHVSIPLSADVSKGFRDVTHREIRDAADTFAWWLVDNYGQGEGFETIAFVGVNDLRYTVVFFGAIKAGYKVHLPMSRHYPKKPASNIRGFSLCLSLHAIRQIPMSLYLSRRNVDASYTLPRWLQLQET